MIDSDRKIIFLTGAPLSGSLHWDVQSLSAPLQECFFENPRCSSIHNSQSFSGPRWRFLPTEPGEFPGVGVVKLDKVEDEARRHPEHAHDDDLVDETSFLTATDLSFVSNTFRKGSPSHGPHGDLLTQFYEHSFAVHEETASSRVQLDYDSSNENTSFCTSFGDSFISSDLSTASSPKNQLTRTRLLFGHLTDLHQIPTAKYLDTIIPQTMTVNLVVGIISIPATRFISTRWGGRTLGMVEMLVGDETKAGFKLTLWVSDPQDLKAQTSGLQSDLALLRPRDVILARNVALSSFGGKVYGQSLRRDMTTLDLLYRNMVDASDEPGAFGARKLEDDDNGSVQVSKLKRVRRWVMEFVGPGANVWPRDVELKQKTGALMRRPQLQALPPDTQ